VRTDVLNAFRSLRASSAFTAVALIVLGLGIGSATAIFSVVDAVVLRGLPYDEHDRLAVVYEKDTRHATTFGLGSITPQTYLDWRGTQQPFQQMAAIGATQFQLKTEGGEPADARAQKVTPEFFPVLRVARRCWAARSTPRTKSRDTTASPFSPTASGRSASAVRPRPSAGRSS